jgi:diketogulonate reductase-like aldo/keto reductase
MFERFIPSSGERLPVIGLGTWIQFDVDPSSPENKNLLQVLNDFQRSGARLIDTSPMYGRSEETIGRLTDDLDAPNDLFYATKVWTQGEKQGIDQMHRSLQLMKRKTMDLLQVHNLVDYQVHLRTLRDWKEQGIVKYTGITHYTVSAHENLAKIMRNERPDFVQFNYSLGVRNAEKYLLPAAKDLGIAVIVNEPLEKGGLHRKFSKKELPTWAKENGMNSWTEIFLKYILSNDAVTCIIPGTSDPDHLKEIIASGNGRLPDADVRKKMQDLL